MPPYEVAFLEPNKFHATILNSLASSCRGYQHFCWEDSGHARASPPLFDPFGQFWRLQRSRMSRTPRPVGRFPNDL